MWYHLQFALIQEIETMSPDHRLDDQSVANKDSLNECEVLEKETAYHDRGGLDGVDDEEVRSRMAKQAAFDRKLLWKMDLIVVPLIAMLYLLVFIDRVNIGNARVAGMQRDLQMNDHQYQTGEPHDLLSEQDTQSIE